MCMLCDQKPICRTARLFLLPLGQTSTQLSGLGLSGHSRNPSAVRASFRFVADMGIQRLRTRGKVFAARTSVIRPFDDCRPNSISKNGSSANHIPRTGSSLGSHTNDPKQAITMCLTSGQCRSDKWLARKPDTGDMVQDCRRVDKRAVLIREYC